MIGAHNSSESKNSASNNWYRDTAEYLRTQIIKIRGGDPFPPEHNDKDIDFKINWYSKYLLNKFESWSANSEYVSLLKYCRDYHYAESLTCLFVDKAEVHKKRFNQFMSAERKLGIIKERQVLVSQIPGVVTSVLEHNSSNINIPKPHSPLTTTFLHNNASSKIIGSTIHNIKDINSLKGTKTQPLHRKQNGCCVIM